MSGLFAALFSRLLGRWRGAIVALACIAVYTLLVGAGASVVRAALMGGLTLFAARQLAVSGYAPANPPEWIEKLSPEVVLLSVAAGDREGRPSAETLEAV